MDLKREIKNIFTLGDIETEGILRTKNQLQKIYNVWIEFGLEQHVMNGRAKIVWNHVQNLLDEVFLEENGFLKQYRERIKNYKDKISELYGVLEMSPGEPSVVAGSWIQNEARLRKELDDLTEIKHRRLKEYQQLKNAELNVCQILNAQKQEHVFKTVVPSEKDIAELEERVKILTEDKEKRQKDFNLARNELTAILEVIEFIPESSLEEDILSGKDTLPLTDETFLALEELKTKARDQKDILEVKKNDLMSKLTIFWQKLKTEESKRDVFLDKYSDYRISTLESIRKEVKKCEAIVNGNIGPYIENLRSELLQIWDKCYVPHKERDLFQHFSSTEYSVEALENHEDELNRWNEYFAKVEHVLKKIEKRNSLWDKMRALETRSYDSNRFRNRKVDSKQLLQKWKEEKNIQKYLSVLENSIFHDIRDLETKLGCPFRFQGEDYKTYVTNQWTERNQQKEIGKVERHNKSILPLGNAIKTPNVIRTPLKRTSSVNIPKPTPRKLIRSKTLYIDDKPKPCLPSQRPKMNNQQEKENVELHKKRILQFRKDIPKATPNLKRTLTVNFAKTAPSKFSNVKSKTEMSPLHTPTVKTQRVVPSTVASKMATKTGIRSQQVSAKCPKTMKARIIL